MIKSIDIRFERWADWHAGHVDQSAIGFPAMTVEGRMQVAAGCGRPPAASISPEVMMSPAVASLDRVYRDMSWKWQAIIHTRYIDRNRMLNRREYCELDRIHYYTLGRLDASHG